MFEESVEKPAVQEFISECICSKTKKKFGLVLLAKSKKTWVLHHAFLTMPSWKGPEAEETATISGAIRVGEEYQGCKHCGAHSLWQCNKCGTNHCLDDEGSGRHIHVKCLKCGMSGTLGGSVTSMGGARD